MNIMYNTILFVLFCVIMCNNTQAQKGKINISNDINLDSAIEKNIERNKALKTIDGYRIQLFSGIERNNANAMKTKFLKLFPETPAYLIYQQPYFKLRVGDYRNKLEAQHIYYKLIDLFGQIIIIPDKINLPKL